MPTPGECCDCRAAPIPRFRFNAIIEDRARRKVLTQLLCAACTNRLIGSLLGQSVERTPQGELDDLPARASTKLAEPDPWEVGS